MVKVLNRAQKVVYDEVARPARKGRDAVLLGGDEHAGGLRDWASGDGAHDPRPGAFDLYLRGVVAVARETDRNGMTSLPEAETLLSPLPAIASGSAG